MLTSPAATTSQDASVHAAAAALGRRGGLKGGPARAEALSYLRRKEIARNAALVRWHGVCNKKRNYMLERSRSKERTTIPDESDCQQDQPASKVNHYELNELHELSLPERLPEPTIVANYVRNKGSTTPEVALLDPDQIRCI